jgi:hypothetical protein
MQRDEQGRIMPFAKTNPLRQWDEAISLSGELDAISASGLEMALHEPCRGQCDSLFVRAGYAVTPIAPGSLPPWPGSNMTSGRTALEACPLW